MPKTKARLGVWVGHIGCLFNNSNITVLSNISNGLELVEISLFTLKIFMS